MSKVTAGIDKNNLRCEDCADNIATFLATSSRVTDHPVCDSCAPNYLYSVKWKLMRYPEGRERRPIIKTKKKNADN